MPRRFANYDIRWVLTCISVLRNYYPERLSKAIVTSAPLAFRVIWSEHTRFPQHKFELREWPLEIVCVFLQRRFSRLWIPL